MSSELTARFARYVERHVVDGVEPSAADLEALVADRPDLLPELRALVDDYWQLTMRLDGPVAPAVTAPPSLPGFRVVDRLGGGGMGEVYKLEDLTLHRVVAGKVIRADARVAAGLPEFLREARALALFQDPRIVQIFEFRADASPPVLLMEYVDGFELGRIGPSLEPTQRARVMREICEAVHHAHTLGLQHRDLKPSNIMLDASLQPKILDFGLSSSDTRRGHLRGTPRYLAPEQLDPSQPLTPRTDVYALGAILYELLAGVAPFAQHHSHTLLEAIAHETPMLPAEVAPSVPEPLQAIALKAMERRPADRYASAQAMAQDLGRYLEGLPVLARPTQYGSALDARVQPHLQQINEWERLRLVYPHEADRLRDAYRHLDAREDDWIVSGRVLSWSQIALYFGAFLLLCGSLFYFSAQRLYETVTGVTRPLLVLGLPFAGLTIAGYRLHRSGRRAVAVAFLLAGAGLLPILLMILLHEAGWWQASGDTQLFPDVVSNRQLQFTIGAALVWTAALAWRTRTAALSTATVALGVLWALAIIADARPRQWLEAGEYDHLALRLFPLVALYGFAAIQFERTDRPWLARPLFLGAAILLIIASDLLALNGRLFHTLGISMKSFQPADVSDPELIDTLAGLTVSGLAFYAVATLADQRSRLAAGAAALLFMISPFSTLEPLAYLVESQQYSVRFDWIYLVLAACTVVASRYRQRKSFYYAGLVNTGAALYLIAARHSWFDRPIWAVAIVIAALLMLMAGNRLDQTRTAN